MHHSRKLSALLVSASADALGGAHEELNHTLGCDIASCLNELTAHLITVGKTDLASVRSAENESTLWEALRSAFANREFSVELLDHFKAQLLAYIRALEQSSACGNVVDELTDIERGGYQVNANQLSNKNDSERSASSQYSHAAPHSTIISEELTQFLEESQDPSHINNPRDTIREIYRTLCADYAIRYKSLLNQKDTISVKDENFKKKLLGLIDDLEKHVLIKLDGVGSISQDLRSIRKAITVNVQRMLDELEAIKGQ